MCTQSLGEDRSLPLGGETSPVNEKLRLPVVFSSGGWEPSAAWGPRPGFLFLKGSRNPGDSRVTAGPGPFPRHQVSPTVVQSPGLTEALGSEKSMPGPAIWGRVSCTEGT